MHGGQFAYLDAHRIARFDDEYQTQNVHDNPNELDHLENAELLRNHSIQRSGQQYAEVCSRRVYYIFHGKIRVELMSYFASPKIDTKSCISGEPLTYPSSISSEM